MASASPTPTVSPARPDGRCLVGGEWVDTGTHAPVLDKYTGTEVGDICLADAALVRRAVVAASQAAGHTPTATLADALSHAAMLVRERAASLAALIVAETGFTRKDANVEVARCIETLRLCADAGRALRGELVPTPAVPERLAFTLRVPVGAVAAITPFNSPLNTVAHKVGPALAAGNGVVVKPASVAPLTAVELVRALIDAGVPIELLNIVHGSGSSVGETLVSDPLVRFVAFTGSTAAGHRIRALAGLKRMQLELGAISCTVLCDDADTDWAVPRVVRSAFRKAGQVCTSVQRLYVHERLYDSVLDQLAASVDALHVGDPRASETDVGPMISTADADRITAWVETALHRGARRVRGGRRQGALVWPTVLVDSPADAAVMAREAFAPLLNVLRFRSDEEVVDSINALPYGLAAGVFSRNVDRGLRFARRLQMGTVYVNDTSSSRIDAAPYGGIKESGFGQEGPARAVLEMTDERLVVLTAVAGGDTDATTRAAARRSA